MTVQGCVNLEDRGGRLLMDASNESNSYVSQRRKACSHLSPSLVLELISSVLIETTIYTPFLSYLSQKPAHDPPTSPHPITSSERLLSSSSTFPMPLSHHPSHNPLYFLDNLDIYTPRRPTCPTLLTIQNLRPPPPQSPFASK